MFFFRNRSKPIIRERTEHCLSRNNIDPDALKVLYRLSNAGYAAYLVGGSVRDLLLGRNPKDFDLGTDARPNEIRRLFRNCFLVGKRFRLAHIVFGNKVVETATFRKPPPENEVRDENGLYQHEDNTFGSPQEDALRRDFTVNGLFYDIKTFSIIDYVGGLKDLKARVLRSIGDPNIRFQEDPVRMMRAMRFAAKLDFSLSPGDSKAVRKHAAELKNASTSRLCEEILRLFVDARSETSFRLTWEHGLLSILMPELSAYIDRTGKADSPVWSCLSALDRDPEVSHLTNGVRFACLCHAYFQESLAKAAARNPGGRLNRHKIAESTLRPMVGRHRLPKAVWMTAGDVMEMLPRFQEEPTLAHGRHARFAMHSIFPDALSFARIIAGVDPAGGYRVEAWDAFYRLIIEQRRQSREAQEEGADPQKELSITDENGETHVIPNPRRRRRRHRFPPRGGAPAPAPASATDA